jgi:hypothetical protein
MPIVAMPDGARVTRFWSGAKMNRKARLAGSVENDQKQTSARPKLQHAICATLSGGTYSAERFSDRTWLEVERTAG